MSHHSLSVEDLQALLESGTYLSQEIDLPVLLQTILGRACELTDSPDASVLLHSEHTGGLYFAAAIGNSSGDLLESWGEFSEKHVPLQGSKAGRVFTTGESLAEGDLLTDGEHFKGVDQDVQKRTQSMVCVRLSANSVPVGVMQILNKESGPYTDRDVALLENFATQAGIALRNAKLIQDLLAHMGLYASSTERESVLELMSKLRAPAHVEVMSVMFADMRGFTQLAQAISENDRTLKLLNDFLSMLCDCATGYGAIVNKFLGDGVMVFFRGELHAQRAVQCAFRMLAGFDRLAEGWQNSFNESLDFLNIGIGIVTDSIVLGSVGSRELRDFTAIGKPVILAASLEAAARAGDRILVDQRTYTAVKDVVTAGPMRQHVLKKVDQHMGYTFQIYPLHSLSIRRAFISYSHEDAPFVQQVLVKQLEEAGIVPWYSGEGLQGGEDWVRRLEQELMNSEWLVCVVSQSSLRSKWVGIEIRTAIAHDRLRENIIPIVIDDTRPAELSPWLSRVQTVDGRDPNTIAQVIRQVIGRS